MSIRPLVAEAAASMPSLGVEPVESLMGELGWRPRIVADRRGRELVSGSLGGQPKVLVSSPGVSAGRSEAVSLGYTHEATLMVLWQTDELSVHPTRSWRSVPGDSPLVVVPTTDLDAMVRVLYAVGRDRWARLPVPVGRSDLPTLLADAFAQFRLGLRDSDEWKGRPRTDPFLLFHQLLFVRMNEDREPDVPDRLLGASESMSDLRGLLDWYESVFDSELFEVSVDLDRFPASRLRTLIASLTEPWADLNLDFSVSDDELAGRLYESYLKKLVTLDEREYRLFAQHTYVDRRREPGAYYTPAPLAEHIVRQTLEPWLAEKRPGEPSEVRVVDPACGSGAFLAAAYGALLSHFQELRGRPLRIDERRSILETSVFGVDIDREALMLARLRLIEIAQLGKGHLPRLDAHLVHADALANPAGIEPGTFDAVLTNPPFAGAALTSRNYDTNNLRSRFPSFKGTGSNLAYAFADMSSELLSPGGVMGLVLPRVALDGPSSQALRENLGGENVAEIVDFGSNLLFEGTSVYISVVCVSSDGGTQRPANLVRFPDRGLTRDEVLEALGESGPPGYAVEVPGSSLDRETRWTPFWHRWVSQFRKLIARDFVKFGDVDAPRLTIGTQLGHQDRFVFDASDVEVQGGVAVIRGHSIPIQFAPLWVKGGSIRPFRVDGYGKRVVLPRLGEDEDVDGLVMELGGPPKSAFPGDLEILRGPKVMLNGIAAEHGAVVDPDGRYMLGKTGGCVAIVPKEGTPDALGALEALLNSAFYQWFLQGIGHSKSSAVEILLHHFQDVPWPILSEVEAAELSALGLGIRSTLGGDDPALYWKHRTELDRRVFDLLGVPAPIVQAVADELYRAP